MVAVEVEIIASPADWLSDGLNAGDQVGVKHNSGLHIPIVSSPVQEHDTGNLDGHSWADSITFTDIAETFNVDNLFDLDNIICHDKHAFLVIVKNVEIGN